jgi:cell division protein FtsB
MTRRLDIERVCGERDALRRLVDQQHADLAALRAEVAAMRAKLAELRDLAVRKHLMCEAVEAEREEGSPLQ